MAELIVRPIVDDEVPALVACVHDVFGQEPAQDPDVYQRVRALVPADRIVAAFDGRQVVATAATYGLTLTVCGGAAVAMGGLTIVTVRPTHRRRGLMRQLIAAHLDDVDRRGEPLSGLYASEGSIYGRFGYGVATEGDELTVVGGDELFAPTPDHRCRAVPLDEVVTTLPAIYAAALANRPGMYARTEPWWSWRRIADRPGRPRRRHVVVERAGVACGYVIYRQSAAFVDGRADGAVEVEELIALDGAAEAALWRHIATIDLYPRITVTNAAVDAIAPWLASDPRRVIRRRRYDTLWLRIGDVAAALAARRYQVDGALTFAITDGDVQPPARWRLEIVDGVGHCAPIADAAVEVTVDVTLDRAALGSIYLGGVAASTLARAGRITGAATALDRLDRMFAWPTPPWCAEQF